MKERKKYVLPLIPGLTTTVAASPSTPDIPDELLFFLFFLFPGASTVHDPVTLEPFWFGFNPEPFEGPVSRR